MPLTFAQITEVTRDKAKQDLLDLLNAIGFSATSWQEGSVPLALVELGAEIWSKLTQSAVFLKEYGLNDTSTGEGLTRFSRSHYANERTLAIAAQRNITLACSATEGPHSIALGGVVVQDPTGKTFRNIDGLSIVYPFTLASGSSRTFLFEAEVAGAASNVGSGTVTKLVTTFAGVTITSDVATKTGADEESDARLRLRNSTKWSTLASVQMIKDAVINVALNASPAVIQVAVDDQNPRGAGTVDVYIAGQTSTLGSTDVDAVQAALAKRFFGAATVQTSAALGLGLSLTGTIYYDSKYTEAAVKSAVEDATGSIYTFIGTIPIGGFSYPSAHTVPKNDIENAIKDTKIASVSVVKTVVLTVPSGDLAIGSFIKVVPGLFSFVYVPVSS